MGLFEGVGGLRGVSGSLLPSFPFNVRKSQMRILNFFSRPEDPKCLKYQNVPNLGSFWAIGEALGEVSELRYKNLLYSSSKRSYCISQKWPRGHLDHKFFTFEYELDKFLILIISWD